MERARLVDAGAPLNACKNTGDDGASVSRLYAERPWMLSHSGKARRRRRSKAALDTPLAAA